MSKTDESYNEILKVSMVMRMRIKIYTFVYKGKRKRIKKSINTKIYEETSVQKEQKPENKYPNETK